MISEFLIGQSIYTAVVHEGPNPFQLTALETSLCGNDCQVVGSHIYSQKCHECSVKELVRSLQYFPENYFSSFCHFSYIMCIHRNDTAAVEVLPVCVLGCGSSLKQVCFHSPLSAERHGETCGMVTGNFHFRCEPRLSSIHVGVENFHEYFAIPVNVKFK